MSKPMNRLLSSLCAFALSFSLLGIAPLQAMAADDDDATVYEYVYGVVGGEYMRLTTKAYTENDRSWTDLGREVLKMDGTEVAYTDENFDLQVKGIESVVLSDGTDTKKDLVYVFNEDTSKYGYYSLDGRELIECKYNEISMEYGGLLAFYKTEDGLCLDFYDLDEWNGTSPMVPAVGAIEVSDSGDTAYVSQLEDFWFVVSAHAAGDYDNVERYLFAQSQDGLSLLGPVDDVYHSSVDGVLYSSNQKVKFYWASSETVVEICSVGNSDNVESANGLACVETQIEDEQGGVSYSYAYYQPATGAKVSLPDVWLQPFGAYLVDLGDYNDYVKVYDKSGNLKLDHDGSSYMSVEHLFCYDTESSTTTVYDTSLESCVLDYTGWNDLTCGLYITRDDAATYLYDPETKVTTQLEGNDWGVEGNYYPELFSYRLIGTFG